MVYFSLLEHTDHKITIRTTAVSDGAKYVDSCESWLKWEIITPDPRSNQVVLRQTNHLHWVNKPFGVSKIIVKNFKKGIVESNETMPQWYADGAADYLSK